MPFEIDISDQQPHLAVDARQLHDVVLRVLQEEQIDAAQISLVLVDDATIHRLNREFLGHDYPTDVISFALDQSPPGALPRCLEGELVVSTETAVRLAATHGWSPQAELLLYVVHGLLHLCGYDDLSDEARPIMRARERQVLAAWQLTPAGLEA
jgi:probable rRNA maturation factor